MKLVSKTRVVSQGLLLILALNPHPKSLQKKSFQVPGPLQNGRQPICIHGHSLCDEGIWLAPGESVQLCEAEAKHRAAQRRLYEAAV